MREREREIRFGLGLGLLQYPKLSKCEYMNKTVDFIWMLN